MKKGLSPIIDELSEILILGSLPGDESIKNQKYYDNSRNQFWKIISYVFANRYIDFKNYDEKITFLKEHHVALWDVIESTDREGSLDNKIKNEKYNDLSSLLSKYNIKSIYVNGGKAEISLKKYIKLNKLDIEFVCLPSSSSLNTKLDTLGKAKVWKKEINKRN